LKSSDQAAGPEKGAVAAQRHHEIRRGAVQTRLDGGRARFVDGALEDQLEPVRIGESAQSLQRLLHPWMVEPRDHAEPTDRHPRSRLPDLGGFGGRAQALSRAVPSSPMRCASARDTAAIPCASKPRSASNALRDPCSTKWSGMPRFSMATLRPPAIEAISRLMNDPKPLTTVPSSTVKNAECSFTICSNTSRS